MIVFLATNLFGWKNVRFEGVGYGGLHYSTSGKEYPVKGYFGIDPATGQEGLFRHQLDTDLVSCRKICQVLEGYGVGFDCNKIPGGLWRATFFYPLNEKRQAYSAEDEEEPFSVCLAARKFIEAGVIRIDHAERQAEDNE